MWTSRTERRGDCLLRPRDCHFIFLACVSKPQYETDWRQKKCLRDSSFWGWGNLVRFFFWGRQALYKHLFLHPSPTYFFLCNHHLYQSPSEALILCLLLSTPLTACLLKLAPRSLRPKRSPQLLPSMSSFCAFCIAHIMLEGLQGRLPPLETKRQSGASQPVAKVGLLLGAASSPRGVYYILYSIYHSSFLFQP